MPPRGSLTDAQEGFAGGWNLTENGRLAPNQYASAFNARIVGDGDLKPRQGTRRTTVANITGGQAIVAGFSWRKADGTVLELMVAADGSVWKGSYSDATGNPVISGTLLLAGSGFVHNATTIPTAFATFRTLAGVERVYIADGDASGLLWSDGTGVFGRIAAAKAFRHIWVYNHRLYGVTSSEEVIYFSALDDGDSLGVIASGGGFATIRTFGGQQLTGGLAIGSTNVLFHRGALSMFRGLTNDDISIDTGSMGISSSIGMPTPAAAAILEMTNALAFAHTSQGAAILTGASMVLLDSPTKPDPLINDPAYPTGFLAAAQAAAAPLFVIRNTRMKEIWFGALGSLPVYVYNYRFNCWVGKLDVHAAGAAKPIRSIWETKTPSGGFQLLYGSSDGFVRTLDAAAGSTLEVYKDDVNQDGSGGTDYAWSATCRRFWCERRRAHKTWLSVGITMRLANGQVQVTTTGPVGAGSPAAGLTQPTGLLDTEHGTFLETSVPKSSQYVDVVLGRTHAAPPPRIAAVDIEAEPMADRGVGDPLVLGVPHHIGVTPSPVSGATGSTAQLTATVYDAFDNVLVKPVVWATSDTLVATVDSTGLVTFGTAGGSCNISATCEGKVGTATASPILPLILDSANRANNAVSLTNTDTGQAWEALAGVWGIDTNQFAAMDLSVNNQGAAVVPTLWPDCVIELATPGYVGAPGSNPVDATGMVWRAINEQNYMLWEKEGSGTLVAPYERVAGVFNNLGSYAFTWTPGGGDVFQVHLLGDKAIICANGRPIGRLTSTRFQTALKHGMRSVSIVNRHDNFRIAKAVVRLMVDGDSISSGFVIPPAVLAPNSGWPSLLVHRQRYELWGLLNYAQAGASVATNLIPNGATIDGDRALTAPYIDNIYVGWGTTNDMVFGTALATLQANYKALFDNRVAAGWNRAKLVGATVITRDATLNGFPQATFDSVMAAFNTWLRATYQTFCGRLADPAADPRFSDFNNATYFADKIHPTLAGQNALADIFHPQIEAARLAA